MCYVQHATVSAVGKVADLTPITFGKNALTTMALEKEKINIMTSSWRMRWVLWIRAYYECIDEERPVTLIKPHPIYKLF